MSNHLVSARTSLYRYVQSRGIFVGDRGGKLQQFKRNVTKFGLQVVNHFFFWFC